MVEFGGGLVIGGGGLQWLVWIQLLVMILLIFLICCFSLYALDDRDGDVRVSAVEEVFAIGDGGVGRVMVGDDEYRRRRVGADTSFMMRSLKVSGSSSIRGEISTSGMSRRVVTSHDGIESVAPSAKDINSDHVVTETHHHPCSIFKFAGEAFLKCLGLDCMVDDSKSRKKGKND